MTGQPHERWIIDNWLYGKNVPMPGDPEFATDLQKIGDAYATGHLAESIEAFHTTIGKLYHQTHHPARTQVAQFWFLGVQLAIASGDWLTVGERLGLAARHIDEDDIISRMQLATWQGVVANRNGDYKVAVKIYTWLLEQGMDLPDLSFIVGNRNSFFCNAKLQRAKALLSIGRFDAALDDLRDALADIYRWLSQATEIPHVLKSSVSFQELPALPDLLIQDSIALHSIEVRTWVELYLWVPWQMAFTVLWQYKIDPAPFSRILWTEIYHNLAVAAQNSERVPWLMSHIPMVHIFAAELALAICEQFPTNAWPEWLQRAESELALAEATAVWAREGSLGSDFRFVLDIERGHCMFMNAVEQEDQSALVALAHQCEKLQEAIESSGEGHVLARCHFMQGIILDELGDQTRAIQHFQTALGLFEQAGEGYFPRSEETRRALEALLADDDEESAEN